MPGVKSGCVRRMSQRVIDDVRMLEEDAIVVKTCKEAMGVQGEGDCVYMGCEGGRAAGCR